MTKLALVGVLLSTLAAHAAPAQYAQTCAVCHATGALGAPLAHDQLKWQAILAQKPMSLLIEHTNKGYKNMPARGLCNSCTNTDMQRLIEYMAQPKP